MTAERLRLPLAAAGLLLGAAAPVVSPSSTLLPAPDGVPATVLAAAVLGAGFALGLLRPLWGLYALVVLVVLEGAIRKWVVNDVTVFLLKDFVALGTYAAVLPTLRRDGWRRHWWLLAPLALLVALAIVHGARSAGLSQLLIGLRSYLVYVPLLWVAPALLTTRSRALGLAGTLLALGALNSVLAPVQALAGPSVLNKLVSGALAGKITLQGEAYIRPAGTFMQTGVMAAWLFVTAVVCLALLLQWRRGRPYAAGLATVGLLAWGVVYSSARSLLGSILLVSALAGAMLVWRRRLVTLAAVGASFGIGLLLVFTAVPWVHEQGYQAVEWVQRLDWRRVDVPRRDAEAIPLRVPPPVAETLPARIARSTAAFTVRGEVDGKITEVVIQDGFALSATTVERSHAPPAGFLGRAADFEHAGGTVPIWSGRIVPQLELIRDQRLLGHGTGTMTLGSGYADEGPTVLEGESMFSKAAWELGLPGLAAFVWLVGALLAVSVLGVWRSDGWQRALALVAAGVTLILPLWFLFTFAFDYPAVAIVVWAVAGCASAYAVRGRAPAPD